METKKDYHALQSDANFVKILQHIQRISTAFEEHIQHTASLAYHIHNFYVVFQTAKEDLHTFVRNFRAHRDTIKDFGGTLGAHPVLVAQRLNVDISELNNKDGALWADAKKAAMNEGSSGKSFADGVEEAFKHLGLLHDRTKKAEEEAEEEFAALMLLRKANREKYKSLSRALQDDKARGTDNYPRTVAAAMHLLASHRPNTHEPRNQNQHTTTTVSSLC